MISVVTIRWDDSSIPQIVVLFLIGCLVCQGAQSSQETNNIFGSHSPHSAAKLLSLVRGGTLHSGYYNNATGNEKVLYDGLDEQIQQRCQPDWRSSAGSTLTPVSMRRSESTEQQKEQLVNNRRHRPLNYRDILQCRSPQRVWSNDFDVDDNDEGLEDDSAEESIFSYDDVPYVDYRGKLDGTRKLSHSPVVYQYYGRSRVRGNPADSIHFILLGPNVDHWKAVGQLLASRGFNAIACERVNDEVSEEMIDRNKDSPNLVMEIMDALKWKRAVLVGCDQESILAMETSMVLAPDRVAGLVLCGDLTESTRFASEAGVNALNNFLRRILDCPFLVISDGDSPSVVQGSSAHKAIETDSNDGDICVILGGGCAAHRLKPEQFAWILTRFVEEKLEYSVRKASPTNNGAARTEGPGFLRALNLPFGIDTMVSPEGRLLLGRAVAASLFYITVMRVAFIQYGVLRTGLIGVKTRYDTVDALRKRVFQAVSAFLLNYGYIPRLFKLKKASEDDEDERISLLSPSTNDPMEETKGSSDLETTDSNENEDSEPPVGEEKESTDPSHDDHARPLFKPFFFLDNVVT